MCVDEKGAGSEGVEEAVEAICQQWRDRLERRRRRRLPNDKYIGGSNEQGGLRKIWFKKCYDRK